MGSLSPDIGYRIPYDSSEFHKKRNPRNISKFYKSKRRPEEKMSIFSKRSPSTYLDDGESTGEETSESEIIFKEIEKVHDNKLEVKKRKIFPRNPKYVFSCIFSCFEFLNSNQLA